MIIKINEIIKKDMIPDEIPSDNINGPVVFKRPIFYPNGPKWIMYFAHHNGNGIRVAESDDLTKNWTVKNYTIIDINKIPGNGHIASPEVIIKENKLELFYHCCYRGLQCTFKSITHNGIDWEYEKEIQGLFYFRVINEEYAIAKYNNDGGIWYKKENDKFIEKGRLLPRMRHCCYHNNKLYWSEIGDMPEVIYRGDLNICDFTIKNKEIIIVPSEDYEITSKLAPSTLGPAVGVTEVRDPYVIKENEKTYIYYTVRGEEGIAIAEIL